MTGYVYSAAGGKLSVSYQTGTGNTSTQYCGNIIYDNNNLSQVLIDGGYITFSGTTPQYHYYLQDHLGSNRVVVNESGTAEQVTHYYPFGGIIANLSTGQDVQKYKYNGKELDLMHGLNTYDYGARQYNPVTARWDRVDPLCEKYYSLSPYNYCGGNPVRYIDPNGEDYNVYYDEENKTITISATYYANNESFEYAQQSANFWNNLSGMYSVDGMTINFNLNVVQCSELSTGNTDDKLKEFEMKTPGESNIFIFRERQRSDDKMNRNGVTYGGNKVTIVSGVEEKYLKYTGPHEMGHSLGLVHEYAGLMTVAASDELRSSYISKNQIRSIIKNSYTGVPETYNGNNAGRGHFIPVNGRMPGNPKFKIRKQ
jgi:RHS repeat-associated protein